MKLPMTKLSQAEWKAVQKLLSKDEILLHATEEQLNQLEHDFDERFLQQFEPELLSHFLTQDLIKQLTMIDQKELNLRLSQAEITAESLASAGGSTVMTWLIQDLLNHLQDKTPTEEAMHHFVRLVDCRNQLFFSERSFIEHEYKRYLEHQLASLS